MNTHPAKLLVMFPMFEARDYRRCLTALDDTLVVHHRANGAFQLELRPLLKFTGRGAKSHAAFLLTFARDLEAGYQAIITGRDQFLADLEQLARQHVGAKEVDAVERALQVVAERTRYQIHDSLFEAPSEYRMGRMVLAQRERRTKPNRNESPGLNMQCGVPTPRTEQLWHSLRHQWCDPRSEAAGMAAWERWCRQNRPAMPRMEAIG